MDVSFIIPFYNGGATLLQCLDSIYAIGLDVNSFEVIIVDDNSPEAALDVLEKYLDSHKNICVVHHSENKRQGGAKNTGIRLAKGYFIAFADQDDFINPDSLGLALDIALRHDVDMLACHYTMQYEDGTIREKGIENGDGLLVSGKEFCENFFQTGCNLAPWANLYKREFLMKVARPYEENVVMEDADWVAWHWIHAGKVGIYNHSIYTWVMNTSSITHSMHYINRADWIKYGYRKIQDSQQYAPISSVFADLMRSDGRNNISGGIKKLWKVNNYVKFYKHLSKELPAIQEMEWQGRVKFLIKYPTLSIMALSIIGPILKIFNYARCKCFR